MSKIILIRHGHSFANKEGLNRFGTNISDSELGLTPRGIKQINNTSELLLQFLQERNIKVSSINIYTSELQRAIDSGEIIKDKLNINSGQQNKVLNEFYSDSNDRELMIGFMRRISTAIKFSRETGFIPFDDENIGMILEEKYNMLKKYFNEIALEREFSIVISHGLALWSYITEHTTDKTLREPLKHGSAVLLEDKQVIRI